MIANQTNNQWAVLAGLRFCLSWIVFSSHIIQLFPNADRILIFHESAKLNSFTAVIGFLVISGFSIAHSIENKPKDFYKRRFKRIYPLYFSALLLSLTPFLIGSEVKVGNNLFSQPDSFSFVGNVLILQSFIVRPFTSNPVFWTLGVECFCYLLTPWFRKLSTKTLIFFIALSSSFFVLYKLKPLIYALFNKLYIGEPIFASLLYGQSFLLILWAWLLGFLYFRLQKNNLYKIFFVTLGCILFFAYNLDNTYQAATTYILTTSLIILSPRIQLSAFIVKLFNYLGDISYPLYLFHFPSFIIIYSILGINNIFFITLLSILVAILSYQIIDVPIRKGLGRKSKTANS